MKQLISFIVIFILFASCKKENNVEIMDPNKIRLNEVIHDSLSKEQIDKIKIIHSTFSEVLSTTLEKDITDFKRDANPDNEIEIWLKMASAYNSYKEKYELNIDEKNEVFRLILSRSMMNNEEAIKNANLKLLNNNQANEVLNLYSENPKPLKVVEK